jgi:hypothetical protein
MTEEELKLETRKVKALEKISNSLEALTVWIEEINKDEWSERIQYYLSEFLRIGNNEASVISKSEQLQKTNNPKKINAKK